MKKFELLKRENNGLCRIRALKSFGDVIKGDIGGYIEKEENLSHEGNCWVFEEAIVRNDARVYEDAQILGKARIANKAEVYGNATVYGDAMVVSKAKVYGNARVGIYATIADNAQVFGDALVTGYSYIGDWAKIHGRATIYNYVNIDGEAEVYGVASLEDKVRVRDKAKVFDRARMSGTSVAAGDAVIQSYLAKDAVITEPYIKAICINSTARPMTIYLDTEEVYKCNIGCQKEMTLEKLLKRIEEDGGMKSHRMKYVNTMKLAEYLL